MARRSTQLLTVTAVLMLVLGTAHAAEACSVGIPPDLNDLAPGVPAYEGYPPVVGVHEYQHIARSPRLIMTGPRSVVVITRYWGEPPPSLDMRLTGSDRGIYLTSGCGDGTRPTGDVAYSYTDERTATHGTWTWSSQDLGGVNGPLTEEQAAILSERFGPPVILNISIGDHAAGLWLLWGWHLLGVLLVAAPFIVARRLIPRLLLR